MTIFLVIVAIVVGIIGFFNLSQATMGVGIICGACLIGIFARIAQAEKYQNELKNKIESINKYPPIEN